MQMLAQCESLFNYYWIWKISSFFYSHVASKKLIPLCLHKKERSLNFPCKTCYLRSLCNIQVHNKVLLNNIVDNNTIQLKTNRQWPSSVYCPIHLDRPWEIAFFLKLFLVCTNHVWCAQVKDAKKIRLLLEEQTEPESDSNFHIINMYVCTFEIHDKKMKV